jgi:hypothetical protein
MSVEITRLSNGIHVVTHHMPHLETTALGIWVKAGARDERAAENGIAHFLEHMAFKGTPRRSARAIAEEIESAGGEINASGGLQQTGGSITGEGVINGSLVSGGIISPGAGLSLLPGGPAGRIFVTGSLTLGNSSRIEISLGSPLIAQAGGYDQLAIGGGLTILEEADATLNFTVTQRPNPGDVFFPLVYAGLNGHFDQLLGLRIDNEMYLEPTFTSTGLMLVAVQIPASSTLCPLALMGLVCCRRRRG